MPEGPILLSNSATVHTDNTDRVDESGSEKIEIRTRGFENLMNPKPCYPCNPWLPVRVFFFFFFFFLKKKKKKKKKKKGGGGGGGGGGEGWL